MTNAVQIKNEYVISWPSPWPLLNTWQRLHFRVRSKIIQEIAQMIWANAQDVIRATRSAPIECCFIHAQRYSGKGKQHLPDWDNLYGGFKPCSDALVMPSKKHPHGLGIIRDDSPLHILDLNARPFLEDECGPRSVLRIIEVEGASV